MSKHRAWTIDKVHSSVEFAVKHMVFATAKGRFADVSGTITYDPGNLAASSVAVEIATDSVDTRDEGRDQHLRSADFFDAGTFPVIAFRSTSIEGTDPQRFQVHGDLTIRDQTRPLVLDAEFNGQGVSPMGPEVISFGATTTINRKAFDLNWNASLETGGVLVGEDVRLSIEIEANAAS